MSKEIYLIQGSNRESYANFKQRIFTVASYLNETVNPDAIKFTLTEKAPPAMSIIPFRNKKMAAISVYNPQADGMDRVRSTEGFRGAYRVDEVLPVTYQKNWSDGDITPGVCLLTLFSSRRDIDYTTFIRRWHNGHTPLSLRIHPLWNYVRNEVKEILTGDSAKFNGIVEEQMQKESDLLNPFKFFGNPLVIIPRMIAVYTDTKSFIDYPSMETYVAAEYHIKTK